MNSNYKLSALKMSDRTTLEFLDCYLGEKCLWNPQHKRYRNKNARGAALRRIANKMDIQGFGPDLALQKFKNLRSSYCQELKKIRTSALTSENGEQQYKPTVVWFSKMDSFIRPYVQQRDTRSSLVSQSPDTSASPGLLDPMFEDTKPEILIPPHFNTKDSNKLKLPQETFDPSNNEYLLNKRHRMHDVPNGINDVGLNDRIQCLPYPSTLEKREDLYDHYGKYVAAVLRGMPPERMLNLQRQINELIYEEQMTSLVDTSNQPESSSRALVECCIYPSTSAQDDEIYVT